jgi:hypothetical protein
MRFSSISMLCAALFTAPALADGNLCFSAVVAHTVCLTWNVSQSNITFTMECSPVAGIERTGWCSVGFPLSPTSTSMCPSEILWLSVLADGSPSFEDRFCANHHSAPTCVAPVSQVIDMSASAGGIKATWTRPLTVTTAGYVNFQEGEPPSLAGLQTPRSLCRQSALAVGLSTSTTGRAR